MYVRDTYAPTGQRIAHIDQLGVAPEEWYLPDGLETLADYTKAGAGAEQFDGVYAAAGLDGKAARVGAGGQAQYYFQDALGSVGQVVDATGAVVRTNFTDAWGAPLAVGLPAPPVGLAGRWGFTGRERDDVSGLMHYRARTYDPAVGRFTSRDPVWHSNLYLYCENHPTGCTDPEGEDVVFGVSGSREYRDAVTEALSQWLGYRVRDDGSGRLHLDKDVEWGYDPKDKGALPREFLEALGDPDIHWDVEDVLARVRQYHGRKLDDLIEWWLARKVKYQSQGALKDGVRAAQQGDKGLGLVILAFEALGLYTDAMGGFGIGKAAARKGAERALTGAIGKGESCLSAGRAETATERARRVGKQGESGAGVTGPKESIKGPISGKSRFPDRIADGVLDEVKNVKKLSFSSQLHDYLAYSGVMGLRFRLLTRPSTKLSGPLRRAINLGLIEHGWLP